MPEKFQLRALVNNYNGNVYIEVRDLIDYLNSVALEAVTPGRKEVLVELAKQLREITRLSDDKQV